MQNDMRDRLIGLIQDAVSGCARHWAEIIADHLIANDIIISPCKIGDDIWVLKGDIKNGWETLKPTHAEKISGGFSYGMLDKNGDLKSTFYLSKEQAEEKLN